ncbi:MAG: hypothetical protein U5R06_20560 [candidate division KSB1 bacterium]|nr:hypothetical protein [candidate division KSB1 bacterium]
MKKIWWLCLALVFSCSNPPQSFLLIDHETPCAIMLDLGPFESALEAAHAIHSSETDLPDSLLAISRHAFCALELRSHLARSVEMRESRIPIFDEKDPVPEGMVIHVGLPSDRSEFRAIRKSVLKSREDVNNPQAFRIDSFVDEKRTVLVLSGNTSIGPLYAGYELLQMIGVRWFFPGETGTTIPRNYNITLPGLRLEKQPEFELRGYLKNMDLNIPADSSFCVWMIRNRINVFPNQHQLNPLLDRGGVKTVFSILPFYEQLLGNNPDSLFCINKAAHLDRLRVLLQAEFADANCTTVALWPPDTWCQCSECSLSTDSEKYAKLLRVVDQSVATLLQNEENPPHFLVHYPSDYIKDFQSFDRAVAGDNFTLLLYAGPRCFNHYSIDPNCVNINYPFADSCMQLFNQTDRKTGISELFNAPYMSELVTAFPSVMRLDVPAYRELGATALLYMNPKIKEPGVQQLVHYQFANQTWNSKIAIDSLNSEYFSHSYGPIAPLMKQFYLYMEASLQSITTWLYYLPIQLKQGWSLRDSTIIRNEKYQPAGADDVNFNKVWEKSYYNIYEARFLLDKAMSHELPKAMKRKLDLHNEHLKHAELVMNMMDGIILYTTLGNNEPEMRQEALVQVREYAEQLKQHTVKTPLFGTDNAFNALNLEKLLETLE